jgi:hypothetical protein
MGQSDFGKEFLNILVEAVQFDKKSQGTSTVEIGDGNI